jgi:uncharacterized protein (TIGR00730 family)
MIFLNKSPKAYHNLKFLNSPVARNLRILAEYSEPLERFKKNKINHTIVFFGSARIMSRKRAKSILSDIKKKGRTEKFSNDPEILDAIKVANIDLNMSRYYDDTVELAYLLTKWSKALKKNNKFIVCSGGGPGIMEAANEGASKAKGYSMGLNISLPFEQYPNRFISPELNFEFHYFFMRKFWFAYLAKALIIMPGGFGTMDELFEILTLIQTQKLHKKITIVVYGTEFWNKIINFKALAEMKMISAEDLDLMKFADTPKEAFEYLKTEITKHYVTK